MKKLFVVLLTSFLAVSLFAQEETPAKFKLYGFIRNYLVTDSRAVNAGTEDMYFYMPQDEDLNADGDDLNEGFNWRYVSLTTRLGLDVSGYKFGKMGVSGKVEADFYNLSGSVPILRLRQAFLKLAWDDSPVTLTMGQTWHPMAADMPHMNNLETGAPFNPFNRSPQVMADVKLNERLSLTGSLLYLNHYLPVGPAGKSKDYFKYGLPEMYLGLTFKEGPFVGKVGVDMVNSKPYRFAGDHKAKGLLTTISPFLFGQYTKGLFQLRAKTILAQSGEHMNLLSGYGISSYDANTRTISYTPMKDWASFVSVQYGKKVQFLGMLGYMKQLGTTESLMDVQNSFWLNTAADTKIQEAVRFTPTVAWNFGKFTVSLEYNITTARFGRGTRDDYGLFDDGKWITNHRLVNMVKFNF